MDWIQLSQWQRRSIQSLAAVNTGMNLRVTENTRTFLTNSASMNFSRNILLHGVRLFHTGDANLMAVRH